MGPDNGVGDDALLVDREHRRLVGIAYRMLGSAADAEDIAQEAWLRWCRLTPAARAEVDRPAAWLTTATTRLALDRLKHLRRARTSYVGPWIPEPLITEDDPAESVELSESLTLAFLTVLERLGPLERAVFVLVDVFGESHADAARIVARSETTCRQILHRARSRVSGERRRFIPRRDDDRLMAAFLRAATEGDLDGLRAMLSSEVTLISDGGPHVRAARHPVVGRERVARFLVNTARRIGPGGRFDPATINREPGALLCYGPNISLAVILSSSADGIEEIRLVRNPAKLNGLRGR